MPFILALSFSYSNIRDIPTPRCMQVRRLRADRASLVGVSPFQSIFLNLGPEAHKIIAEEWVKYSIQKVSFLIFTELLTRMHATNVVLRFHQSCNSYAETRRNCRGVWPGFLTKWRIYRLCLCALWKELCNEWARIVTEGHDGVHENTEESALHISAKTK